MGIENNSTRTKPKLTEPLPLQIKIKKIQNQKCQSLISIILRM